VKKSRVAAALAALSLAAVLAPATHAVAAPATTQLILGAVPGQDLGLIELAKVRGSFAAEGLDIKIVPLDSGPNVVVGVVAGQYDLGYTAYAPPLLAYANGSPLRVVSGVGTVGKDGLNGGTLVRKDSGINSWKDLAGKKIGTNAPRSLFSLTVPAAIAANGGDPSKIQLIPLPFSEIPKAVADGRIDAGVALEPFLSKGLADNSNLRNLGDSTHDKYEDAEDDPRRRVGGAERSEHGCSQWYAGELLGEESTYGYVTLVVQTGAALIAATQIARAGVVGSPWCWAPLWVLGFQALAWAVPQIVFVPIGPGAIQSWADLLVLVGALAALSGTLGLGIMALVLAAQQRPDTVEVYRSA